jgi:hypothetical protein
MPGNQDGRYRPEDGVRLFHDQDGSITSTNARLGTTKLITVSPPSITSEFHDRRCSWPTVNSRATGTFTKDPPRAKLSYSVMLLVRGKMPSIFSVQLEQAVTIATRYSMVRAQGLGHGDALKSEVTIV